MANNQIGDYIHAHYSNYLRYSITHDQKQSSEPDVNLICQNQKNALKMTVQKSSNLKGQGAVIKQSLENKANAFFNTKNSKKINTELTDSEVDTIEEAVKDIAEEKFDGLLELDFGRGKATSIKSKMFDTNFIDQSLLDSIRKLKKLSGEKKKNIDALQKRYEYLMDLRDQIVKNKQNKNFYYSKEFLRELDGLQQGWEQFEKNILTYKLNRGISSINYIPSGQTRTTIPWVSKYGSVSDYKKNGSYEKLDDKINRLISSILTSATAAVTGYLGEAIAKSSYYVVATNANATVDELKSFLRSTDSKNNRSYKGISSNNLSYYAKMEFSDDFDPTAEDAYKKTRNITEKDLFHTQSTENKVDFTFFVNGWDVNTSIKDYDLSSKNRFIHIEEGADLLRLVQDYPIFINHFLNIVGERSNFDNYNDDHPDSNDINKMHQMMKLSIFLKALAGGVITSTGRNTQADVLLVTDNSRAGQYKAYFISDILDQVSSNINLIHLSSYDTLTWPNRWIGPQNQIRKDKAAMRISYLIANMRKASFEISLSANALKSI